MGLRTFLSRKHFVGMRIESQNSGYKKLKPLLRSKSTNETKIQTKYKEHVTETIKQEITKQGDTSHRDRT